MKAMSQLAVAQMHRGGRALAEHPLVVLGLLLGLAPAVLALHFVTLYWLPLPYWDEWATPGGTFVSWCNGTLRFSELVAQHNESRKFFPRLLYLALAIAGGWDVRQGMALCFGSVCAIGGLFYQIMRQTTGATTRSAMAAWLAAMFLCFSSVQLENFLWGVQFEPFIPGLAVLAVVLVNTSRLPIAAKSILNAILSLIATYTFANGMLLWVLAAPIPSAADLAQRKKLYVSYASYALAAALAIGGYFIGYEHPGHHPQMLPAGTGVGALLHYILLWIGSYFNSPNVKPLAVGMMTVILLLSAITAAVAVAIRNRDWRTFYPSFIIAAYACATAGITAVGRIGFGVEQALDSRYRTFSLFFYLAAVALLFALYCSYFRRTDARRRALFVGGCSALAAVALAAWIACYLDRVRHQQILYTRNANLIRALQWVDVIPTNPDLHFIYPIVDELIERSRLFRDKQLLHLPYPERSVVQQVETLPRVDSDRPVGQLETCMFDSNHNLFITGWAKLPMRKHYADTIVIGCQDASGAFKLFSVMKTDPPWSKRGRKSQTPRMTFSRAFDPANIPPGDITIAGWAVDMRAATVYPLGGATFIRSEQR